MRVTAPTLYRPSGAHRTGSAAGCELQPQHFIDHQAPTAPALPPDASYVSTLHRASCPTAPALPPDVSYRLITLTVQHFIEYQASNAAATPPDVRRGSAPPLNLLLSAWGYAPGSAFGRNRLDRRCHHYYAAHIPASHASKNATFLPQKSAALALVAAIQADYSPPLPIGA
jgi:hypothetical protein